jgi:hypothetical protein
MKTAQLVLVPPLLAVFCFSSVSAVENRKSFLLQNDSDEIPRNSILQNSPCGDQPKSLKEVTSAFNRGRLPLAGEVTGSWVEIGFFGQDARVRSLNCVGITRGRVFEFVIVASQYSLTLHSVGMDVPQKVMMEPDQKGSVRFPVDFGGDASPVYRCRVSRPNTLTCLNAVYGEGIEFKKMSVREEQIFPRS